MIGVLSILLAIGAPRMLRVKTAAASVVSVSNARQIHQLLAGYAVAHRDRPPVIFQPLERYFPAPAEVVEIDGRRVLGNWFNHSTKYRYVLGPSEPGSVFFAPGANVQNAFRRVTDYWLTETLYAEPSYWNRWTQRGPAQWGAQAFTDIRYPSDKGLIWQMWVYGLPGFRPQQQTQFFGSVPAAVAWADGGASSEDLTTMHPGEPNFFRPDHPNESYTDRGFAIEATLHGIHGRDRGGVYALPTRR